MMKVIKLSFLVLLCLGALFSCDRYGFEFENESSHMNTSGNNVNTAVHEWKMDSLNSDGAVNDLIGTLHLDDYEGGAISLDSVNKISGSSVNITASQLMLKNNDTQINYDNSISLEVWIKSNVTLPKLPPKNEIILEKYDQASLEGFQLFIRRTGPDANKICCSIFNFDGIKKTIISTTLVDNNTSWYHIIAVCNGTDLILYVNGIKESSISLSGTDKGIRIPSDYDFKIGGRSDVQNESFIGNIDEVRVYNSALSENQVKTRYNQTKL